MSRVIDESVLDDGAALAAGDPGEMLRAVASAGAQVREAVLRTGEAELARVVADGRPRAVVVSGMGGSGISADTVAAVTGQSCPVPVVPHRGYRLPGWVGGLDLVVAVSCSGRTEETLAVADEALRRGCRLVTVSAEGSPLSQRAQGQRAVSLNVDAGGRMPRANFWALSVPVLRLADALGLTSVPVAVLEDLADELDRLSVACAPASETYANPAKQLALELAGSLPCLWGTSDLAAVAAYRFACQLAENAKYPALYGALPEVHHNQVVALAGAFGTRAPADEGDIFRDRVEAAPEWPRLRLVLLRDAVEEPQVARRREATSPLADECGVPVSELAGTGEHPVTRLAGLIAPADFASVYLALLQGLDPTPIEPIVRLKERITR